MGPLSPCARLAPEVVAFQFFHSFPVCLRRKGTHPGGVAALALIEKRSIEITGGIPPGCISLFFPKPAASLALNHRLIAAKPLACPIVVTRACGFLCGMPVSFNCTPCCVRVGEPSEYGPSTEGGIRATGRAMRLMRRSGGTHGALASHRAAADFNRSPTVCGQRSRSQQPQAMVVG